MFNEITFNSIVNKSNLTFIIRLLEVFKDVKLKVSIEDGDHREGIKENEKKNFTD